MIFCYGQDVFIFIMIHILPLVLLCLIGYNSYENPTMDTIQ
ncbi:hypothetical protein CLOSTASPAR_03174 [[Clostridium] asparagiforme DSM 15981]|uniref:Uncharacterized protein n=1 Tax=[Clostridium] asparagiforme DSM 15981 TaxID=518636 RepID=C0D1N5_9FIRM|nr:hypothetical protein CLOSTASPAR_03174 [[Clostridium] asparagiforme DSM 15981]